ncbi:MAG TPA: hypothetical protein VGH74_16700, partial [Planctomycetaceae bacterium]
KSGGPAACFAPAGSRSDKRLRHVRSIVNLTHHHGCSHRGCRKTSESTWRSLLSLRDPTALTGRSGHPLSASQSRDADVRALAAGQLIYPAAGQ